MTNAEGRLERPQAVLPLVRKARANAPIRLYAGEGTLQQAGHEYAGDLAVSLEWTLFPEIQFRLDCRGPFEGKEPHTGIPAPLLLASTGREEDATVTHWEESGLDPEALQLRMTGLVQGSREPVNALGRVFRAHVANFRDFEGAPVWYGPRHAASARLSFSGQMARVTLDKVAYAKEVYEGLDDAVGFGITSVLEVENLTEMSNEILLTRLHLLLSFFSGRWVSIVLPFAASTKRGRLVLRAIPWALWAGQPWAHSQSWLPRMVRDDFGEMVDAFLLLVEEDTEEEVVSRAIRWYIEANTNPYVASSIVIAHSALELLAYYILVQREQMLSRRKFVAMASAAVFEELFQWLNVPNVCPLVLSALGEEMTARGWETSASAIAQIRNQLVHPERRGRALSHRAQYEVLHLIQWYTELAVLKLLRYQGPYQHRVSVISRRSTPSFGEPVPWAAQSPPAV